MAQSTAKDCTKCGLVKPVGDFYQRSGADRQGTRYMSECKECNKAAIRARAKASADERFERFGTRMSDAKIRKQYGVSLEEYAERMQSSERCEVCGTTKHLCYDHDHETMAFRGVLCKHCNNAFGLLGDDLKGAMALLNYARRHYGSEST